MEKSKVLGYSINLKERGYFEADVRDKSGKTIWSLDTATAMELHEDGFVKDVSDPSQIEEYLKSLNIIGKDMQIQGLTQAEEAWDDEDIIEIYLPQFHGFCDSVHSEAIEYAVDNMFQDDAGDSHVPDDFYSHFTIAGPIMNAYAKEYVDGYKHMLEEMGMSIPSMELKEVVSPREYNFTTDRIIVTAKASEVEKAIQAWSASNEKEVSIDQARQFIEDRAASRSGFHSFYEALVEYSKDSTDPLEWFSRDIFSSDANEVGLILGSLVGNSNENGKEWEIMSGQHMNVSEEIERLVHNNMSSECKKMALDFAQSRDHSSGMSPD